MIFVPDAALVRPDSVLRLHPEWRSLKLDETALLGYDGSFVSQIPIFNLIDRYP